MSRIELINASCADQTVDAVVNAANGGLWAGGGAECWRNVDGHWKVKSR